MRFVQQLDRNANSARHGGKSLCVFLEVLKLLYSRGHCCEECGSRDVDDLKARGCGRIVGECFLTFNVKGRCNDGLVSPFAQLQVSGLGASDQLRQCSFEIHLSPAPRHRLTLHSKFYASNPHHLLNEPLPRKPADSHSLQISFKEFNLIMDLLIMSSGSAKETQITHKRTIKTR